jgi:hypothetical protein
LERDQTGDLLSFDTTFIADSSFIAQCGNGKNYRRKNLLPLSIRYLLFLMGTTMKRSDKHGKNEVALAHKKVPLKSTVLTPENIIKMHLKKIDNEDVNSIIWFGIECNAGLLNQMC